MEKVCWYSFLELAIREVDFLLPGELLYRMVVSARQCCIDEICGKIADFVCISIRYLV